MNPGFPRGGPYNDPSGSNFSSGGNPGPGGNRPPTNELGINQLSGNKDNQDKDYKSKADVFTHLFSQDCKRKFYSNLVQVRPEMFSEPIDSSTRHFSHLRSQENLPHEDPSRSPTPGPSSARPGGDSDFTDWCTQETLNTNVRIGVIQRHNVTCTYSYNEGKFSWALLQGSRPSDHIYINEYDKFTSWYVYGEFIKNNPFYDMKKLPDLKTKWF